MSDTPKDPTDTGEGPSSHNESPENTPVIKHAEADDSQDIAQTSDVQQEQTSTVVNLQDEKRKRGRPAKPPRPPRQPTNDWRDHLLRNEQGNLFNRSYANARLILTHHEDFKDALAFDLWRTQVVLTRNVSWSDALDGKGGPAPDGVPEPRPLADEDLTAIVERLEKQGQRGFSTSTIADVVIRVAMQHKFNPLIDWLEALKWDGKSRIDNWLIYYLGAKDTPYIKSVGAKYLISAVARALQPGCKMDNILILEGEQGRRKSTALMTLFGEEYFTDQLGDLSGKDASMQLQGIWCVELPELTSLDRSSSRQIKEWLSRRTERFRPPFGRALKEYPRQCIIAGTTNPEGGYLKDPTGARRFWPVETQECDIDAIRHDRDQLWAEAVARYRRGEQWWLSEDEAFSAVLAQRSRYDRDAWHDPIKQYVTGKDYVTIQEILSHFSIPLADMGQREKNRVATELTFLGWQQKITKILGRSMRVYQPGPKAILYAQEVAEGEELVDLEVGDALGGTISRVTADAIEAAGDGENGYVEPELLL